VVVPAVVLPSVVVPAVVLPSVVVPAVVLPSVVGPVVVVSSVVGPVVVVVVSSVVVPLSSNSLTIVEVQVTVLAPPVPESSHWVMVVGSPVLCEGGAVKVQVTVPSGPPESLHWLMPCPPGPPVPVWSLPAGVPSQVSVAVSLTFSHCRMSATVAVPSGKPVRVLVTVTVQVTVLAPTLAMLLHWLITVIGVVDSRVSFVSMQSAPPLHCTLVTIVASPVGLEGSLGLYVKLLVTVIVQVTVLAPIVGSLPTSLH